VLRREEDGRAVNVSGERLDGWRRRGKWFVDLRAVSIPTAVVRRFFEIDGLRKAMLIAFNLFISLIPLAVFALAIVGRHNEGFSLSDVLIRQFGVDASTADIIRDAFPQNRDVLKVMSVVVVGSFAISGFDVASAVQRAFADAWRVRPMRGLRGWARGAIWFVLTLMIFWLGQLLYRLPARHGGAMYLVTVPAIMAANFWFWVATPALMLDKKLARRDLRRGAMFGMLSGTALWSLSLVFLRSWFQWYGEGFQGIGIAFALLSWIYVTSIVWVLIIVVAAVLWERSAPFHDIATIETAPADT
jgi:uncharacterized BrkB/YihY/UPF0761 family membrane protein